MSNYPTFKVLLPGEGKTKWLIEKAFQLQQQGDNNIYYYSNNEHKYIKFCNKYLQTYDKVCPVMYANNSSMVSTDASVLIDDMMELDSLEDIRTLRDTSHMYITIGGELD